MENKNPLTKTGKSSLLEINGQRYIACMLNEVSTLGILMGYSLSGLSIFAFPWSKSAYSNRCMILVMSNDTFINIDQPIYAQNYEGVRAPRVYYEHMKEAVTRSALFNKLQINKFVWMDASAVCEFVNDN